MTLARTSRATPGRLVSWAPCLQQTRSPLRGQGSPQPKQNSCLHRHVMWLQPEMRSTGVLHPGQICTKVLAEANQAIIQGASAAQAARLCFWRLERRFCATAPSQLHE